MNKINICKVSDCGKSQVARGWCLKHYRRWQKHGKTCAHKKPGDPKLVKSDIVAIRADNRPIQQIASDYDIDQSNVSLIKNRKRWVHVK